MVLYVHREKAQNNVSKETAVDHKIPHKIESALTLNVEANKVWEEQGGINQEKCNVNVPYVLSLVEGRYEVLNLDCLFKSLEIGFALFELDCLLKLFLVSIVLYIQLVL